MPGDLERNSTAHEAAPPAPIRPPDLRACDRAIEAAFPELGPVGPLRRLGAGWDNHAVETAGGLVFRFPKNENAAAYQRKTARLLPAIAPGLALPLPIPEWIAGPMPGFPHGFSGHRKIEGVPLRDAGLQGAAVRTLAGEVGRLLAALHAIPAAAADGLELAATEDVRAEHRADWPRLAPVIEAWLPRDEAAQVRHWHRDFVEDDRLWRFTPRFTHNDLGPEHVLVDKKTGALLGVIDWDDAAFTDPAVDFAGLNGRLGPEGLDCALRAYAEEGGEVDSTFRERVQKLDAYTAFSDIRYAANLTHLGGGPSKEEAVDRMRRLIRANTGT